MRSTRTCLTTSPCTSSISSPSTSLSSSSTTSSSSSSSPENDSLGHEVHEDLPYHLPHVLLQYHHHHHYHHHHQQQHHHHHHHHLKMSPSAMRSTRTCLTTSPMYIPLKRGIRSILKLYDFEFLIKRQCHEINPRVWSTSGCPKSCSAPILRTGFRSRQLQETVSKLHHIDN